MIVFLLPVQLGIHFWPSFSFVRGLRIDYLSPVIYVTDLLIIILLIFWLYDKRRGVIDFIKQIIAPLSSRSSSKHIIHSTGLPVIAVLVIIAIYLLTKALFAPSPPLAFYGLFKYIELVLFGCYIAANINTKKQLRMVALIFSISIIIQSLIAVFQYLNQSSLNGAFYYLGERKFNPSTPGIANASINGSLVLRPYATFPHPNVLAGFLLTGIVFVYTFLRGRENIFITILKFTSLTLASTALMLSLSRTAILIWLILITYLFSNLIRKQFSQKKKITILFSAVLIAFLLFLFFNLPVFSRITSSSLFEKSVTARQDLAGTALKAISGSPLYGIGHYHFLAFRGATAPPDGGFNSIQPVHNIFLLITAENGLIGLILFLALFIFTFKNLIKNNDPHEAPASMRLGFSAKRGKTGLLLIIIIIALLGLFDHYWLTIQQGQLLFALFMGLSWALQKKHFEDNK